MLDRPRPDIAKAYRPINARCFDIEGLCRVLAEEAVHADSERAVTPATWAALARSGLWRAPFPHDLGGEDLVGSDNHAALALVLRRLGGADLSVARLVEGHFNAVLLVRRYGTAAQVTALRDAVDRGGLSGVWGAEGVPPLKAERSRAGWLLSGGKALASGAGSVTHPLVPVAFEDGPVLVMPELSRGERADLSGWTAQGMRSTATGVIDLTGLTLRDDQVIGGVGDFTRQPFFSGGAWRFCAVHLGAAERLVDLLRDHLRSRGRDGDPYQAQRVSQATVAVTTARFWVEEAARLLGQNTAASETIVAFANLTRGVTERAALDVLELVHRGVGLNGFLHPNPIERISRDLATYLRQPVPDLAMADAARAISASERATADLWTGEP